MRDTTSSKNTKYQRGNFVSPNNDAPPTNVREVKAIIPTRVIEMTGADALLWKKGILEVRRKCKIKTCVHIDSKTIQSETVLHTEVAGKDL